MAWHLVSELKQLVLTINNTDIEINNFKSVLPFGTELTPVLANPYPNIARNEGYSYSDSWNPSEYNAALASLVSGSLNLFAYYLVMNMGDSLYLWRKDLGRNVNITFTKGNSKFTYFIKWYNYTSSTAEFSVEPEQYPNVDICFTSIGFLIDAESGYGSIYSVKGVHNTTYTSRYKLVTRDYRWGISGAPSDAAHGIFALLFGNEPEPTPGGDNPYAGGGYNDTPAGGEEQDWSETSDVIAEPTLPFSPATGSGFITAYVPTMSEINDIADYLIDPSVLQVLAGAVMKLSDVIIGLSIFPFTVVATGAKEVKMNFCGAHLTTGVTCHYSDDQFVTLNMGSLEVTKCWDNCLDYDPYTRVSLYLPYIGYVDIDTDEVMGKEITIKYNIDIVTGCCVALIIIDGSVMYQYPGEVSCQIPITSVSFDSFLQSAINLGLTATSASRAIKGAGSAVSEAGSEVLSASGKNAQLIAMDEYESAVKNFDGIKANARDSLLAAGASTVLNAKGSYSHAGALSTCAGILSTQKPFLIIKRPRQCMPVDYETIRGFPCNMKATLGDLSGYTEVSDIHLNIPDATVQEIVECEQYLKGGVYL